MRVKIRKNNIYKHIASTNFLYPSFTRQAIPKKSRHKLATANTFELTTTERLALSCNNAPLGCANNNFLRAFPIPHIHNILTNRPLSVMYSRMNLLGMIVKHLQPTLLKARLKFQPNLLRSKWIQRCSSVGRAAGS